MTAGTARLRPAFLASRTPLTLMRLPFLSLLRLCIFLTKMTSRYESLSFIVLYEAF
jgi:hypothetical protein